MAGTVVITYLELAEPDPCGRRRGPRRRGSRPAIVHDPGVNRDMYRRVGGDYQWVDRLRLERRALGEYAARVETHLVELDGRTAGYFEIELDSGRVGQDRPVRAAREFHGIGLGGHALTAALNRARELRPRVWLTTCTLDGPLRAGELPRPRDAPVPHRDAAGPGLGWRPGRRSSGRRQGSRYRHVKVRQVHRRPW